MSGKKNVPDAWDDDWTNVADTKNTQPVQKLSKAEKRIQHQQLQKELWTSAEDPSRNLWLESKGAVAAKQQDFVPTMTLLSRRPQQGAQANDEDSEEEARKKRASELEERQRKAKLEREEKVRKYAEARERIMGSAAPKSPKLKSDSRESSQGRNDGRRGRGNASGQSSSRQSPAQSTAGSLYDPDDMSRRVISRRDGQSDQSTASRDDGVIRQPRGPENTGRGGFGFQNRGGRQAAT